MKMTARETYRLLLVDDNRDGLLVRRALLEELGHTVDVAESGERALRLLEAGTYHVVVTDHCMPGMNGTELIRTIRKASPQARVILLSGFVEGMGLTEENTGADIVLMKSAREGLYLVRAVNRLMSPAPRRKPPTPQKNNGKWRAAGR